MTPDFVIRPADSGDPAPVAALLRPFAEKKIVLERNEEDIRFYLANFLIADACGEVVGCVAVRDFGNSLFEVRSLAVREDFQKHGVGAALINSAVERLQKRCPEGFRLFTLTLVPGFFERAGFVKVQKELFPEKIWSDCSKCPKLDVCDEVALLLEK